MKVSAEVARGFLVTRHLVAPARSLDAAGLAEPWQLEDVDEWGFFGEDVGW